MSHVHVRAEKAGVSSFSLTRGHHQTQTRAEPKSSNASRKGLPKSRAAPPLTVWQPHGRTRACAPSGGLTGKLGRAPRLAAARAVSGVCRHSSARHTTPVVPFSPGQVHKHKETPPSGFLKNAIFHPILERSWAVGKNLDWFSKLIFRIRNTHPPLSVASDLAPTPGGSWGRRVSSSSRPPPTPRR